MCSLLADLSYFLPKNLYLLKTATFFGKRESKETPSNFSPLQGNWGNLRRKQKSSHSIPILNFFRTKKLSSVCIIEGVGLLISWSWILYGKNEKKWNVSIHFQNILLRVTDWSNDVSLPKIAWGEFFFAPWGSPSPPTPGILGDPLVL